MSANTPVTQRSRSRADCLAHRHPHRGFVAKPKTIVVLVRHVCLHEWNTLQTSGAYRCVLHTVDVGQAKYSWFFTGIGMDPQQDGSHGSVHYWCRPTKTRKFSYIIRMNLSRGGVHTDAPLAHTCLAFVRSHGAFTLSHLGLFRSLAQSRTPVLLTESE